MRIFGAILLAGLLSALPALGADPGAAPVPAADQTAIRQVIQNQLRAFQHDDGATAFGFASPGIQAIFGDAAHFMGMVRQAYQPVYRPRSVTFGALTAQDGRPVQRVEVVGPDGSPATALYFMEHEQDGSWRIDGCVIEPAEGTSA